MLTFLQIVEVKLLMGNNDKVVNCGVLYTWAHV